jgi:hypothetical protein
VRKHRVPHYVIVGCALLFFVNNAFALDLPPIETGTLPVEEPPVELPPVEESTVELPPVELPPVESPTVEESLPEIPQNETISDQNPQLPPSETPSTPAPSVGSDKTSDSNDSGSSGNNNVAEQISNNDGDENANTAKSLQIQPSANITDSQMLHTWAEFSAALVNGNQTIAINNTSQIPQVVSTNSVSKISQDVQSVLLDVSFPPLTNGIDIVSTLGLPTYTLPSLVEAVPIIPALVTTVDSGSGQFIVAPLGKILPGQKVIISVADSVIPSFGGLKEISFQPSKDAAPIGQPPPDEWMTAEVNDGIPSSLPTDGLDSKPVLFINIQYPFEQSGTGYNWGDPKTHAQPPTMTIVLNKDIVEIKKDDAGCPIVDAYTLSSGTWTSNGLGEISSESISPEKCHIVIQTQHFSKFAFSLRHINSIQNSGPGLFGLGTVISGTSADYLVQDKADIVNEPEVPPVTEFAAFAEPSEGFDGVHCMQSYAHTLMIGKYTNGDKPLGLVILKMTLLDSLGNVIATGKGNIADIEAHQTKEFHAITRHAGNFDSCSIHVSSKIPKIRN